MALHNHIDTGSLKPPNFSNNVGYNPLKITHIFSNILQTANINYTLAYMLMILSISVKVRKLNESSKTNSKNLLLWILWDKCPISQA